MIHKILNCVGFQWDTGNSEKNWISHQVSKSECEQIFLISPSLLVMMKNTHNLMPVITL